MHAINGLIIRNDLWLQYDSLSWARSDHLFVIGRHKWDPERFLFGKGIFKHPKVQFGEIWNIYIIYNYIDWYIHYWYYDMSIILYFIKINGSIHAKAAKAIQLHQMFATCLGCDTVDWSSCVRYLGSMCKILYTQVRCFIADCRNGAIDRSFYIPIPQFLRLFRWIVFFVVLLLT